MRPELTGELKRLMQRRSVLMEILADDSLLTELGEKKIRDKLKLIQEQIHYYTELTEDYSILNELEQKKK